MVFFDGVAADIVINNGEELALISRDPEFIEELHGIFGKEYDSTVILLGNYELLKWVVTFSSLFFICFYYFMVTIVAPNPYSLNEAS